MKKSKQVQVKDHEMPDTLSVHLPPFDYNDDPMVHGAGRTARVERLPEPWEDGLARIERLRPDDNYYEVLKERSKTNRRTRLLEQGPSSHLS